jgi:hypothetical protein
MTLLKLSAYCRRRLTSVNPSSNGSAETRQRRVQQMESTRQPFSAIHSVVKRTPSAIPSASWPPMNLSIVPPTNGTLTSTVAV